MGIQRSTYNFIVVSIIVLFLITGSEARARINAGSVCPGVCQPGVEPVCSTLCGNLGFPQGYCEGLTCCCNQFPSPPPPPPS
ncbi:unnamed protein product [Brassica napus]|uniref:(rape) hypothetical protein n=1 Tax=Brassica napus TaxID=3708 RepID=A0A816NKW0_BRANA|nr:unnamed protein product [Brassica napus]